jgi:thymidylate kinase
MKEAALPQIPASIVWFDKFLELLIKALEMEGICPCILRNYNGFPATNAGNDVDFLIAPFELPRAVRALHSIRGVQIVGFTERRFAACVFLEGISSTPESRSLQIDFFWNLGFRGLPYLPTDAVLQAANRHQAGQLNFFVPSPVHEAIISLFASLLHGGWLKEKYFPQVQQTFANDRSEVIAALLPRFAPKIVMQLVNAVIDGDRQRVRDCITPLRRSLTLRTLIDKPFRGPLAIMQYYAREFVVRLSPKNLETVCFLGAHGSGKTTIIEELMPMLHSSAQVLEKRHFRAKILSSRKSSGDNANTDPDVKGPSGFFIPMAKIVLWLMNEWSSQFVGKKNLTLRILDSYYDEILIDPEGYADNAPRWFARLAGMIVPSPDLWILLDPVAEGLESRSQEPSPAKIFRQFEAYRRLIKTKKKYVILNASRPIASVTEDAYAAIIHALAQRTDGILQTRF